MTATSAARHAWIEKAAQALRRRFAERGYSVPHNTRISIGFPKGSRKGAHLLGQCWGAAASTDGHHEIFVSPELCDGVRIFDVLCHEFCHAVVGLEAGHKAMFKGCAEALGLTGKMTATVGSEQFNAWARDQISRLGAYPAGGLRVGTQVKKQGTRLLKCACSACGYTVRTTAKWLDVGAPICPSDMIEMTCDDLGEGE